MPLMAFSLQAVVWMVVLGLLFWMLKERPIDPSTGKIVRVISIACVALWLLFAVAELPV